MLERKVDLGGPAHTEGPGPLLHHPLPIGTAVRPPDGESHLPEVDVAGPPEGVMEVLPPVRLRVGPVPP